MYSYLTKITDKSTIINLLFSTLIFSFIAGNLVVNLNLALIILVSFFFFGKKIFTHKLDLIDKMIILFFFYTLSLTLIKNIDYKLNNFTDDFEIFLKSILFIRFLIFYFIIKFLIKNDLLSLKIFFISSSFAVLFVALDIIYQFIFGQDIFGFEGIERRLSGPFGDEIIAGSYIQRFSLFALFILPIFFNLRKKYIQYFLIALLISILLISLVLAGNRIPLLLFVTLIFLISIFEKNLRKFFFPFLIIGPAIIYLISSEKDSVFFHLSNFKTKTLQIFSILSPDNILTEKEAKEIYTPEDMFYTFEFNGKKYKLGNTHLKEFNFGVISWQKNKYFGGGMKSLGITCIKNKFLNCSSHPHNYYLEILAVLGLLGFTLIFILFSLLFYKTFLKKYFFNSYLNDYSIITPFIFLFFAEIFPLKSTGSFFTTSNATYIFLILSILVSLSQKKIR